MSTVAVNTNVLRKYPLNVTSVTLTLNTAAEVIAAPSDAYESIYVLSLAVSNTSATLTRLDLTEAAGGTIKLSMALAASGGGFVRQYKGWWKLPAGVALSGILSTGVTDVRVNVEYFIGL